MIKTALFAAAAVIATVATAAPVLAEEVSVTYKDLDLTTASGKAQLARRLDNAAREACGYQSGSTGTRLASRTATDCYKQARQRSKDSMAAIISTTQKGG